MKNMPDKRMIPIQTNTVLPNMTKMVRQSNPLGEPHAGDGQEYTASRWSIFSQVLKGYGKKGPHPKAWPFVAHGGTR